MLEVMEIFSWCALSVCVWEIQQHAQRSSGNWLLTARSWQPQGHIDLAPQDLFLKSDFRMGCAKIWLTSHTKQETKKDGVTLTSFRKAPGSNLNRGTNYPHWGPCFPQSLQMFWDNIFSAVHNYLLKNGLPLQYKSHTHTHTHTHTLLFKIVTPSVQFITTSV